MAERQVIIDAFERDGFAYIPGFLTPAEADELEANFDRFVADIVPTMPRNRAMYEDYNDPKSLKQLDYLDRFDPWFHDFKNSERFLDLARGFLHDEVVPQHIAAFIKPPHQGTPTPPHQDGYYFKLHPNEALTFWVPVGDIDAENGAVCYIKGSHKKGMLQHGASGVLGFSQGMSQDLDAIGETYVGTVRRGDCLVHHSMTVHFAAGNPTGRTRRAIGLVYYAERAKEDREAMERYHANVREQQAALGVT